VDRKVRKELRKLRALQEKQMVRVGLSDEIDIDAMTPAQRRAFERRFPPNTNYDNQIPGEFGVWNKFSDASPDNEIDILIANGKYVDYTFWSCMGVDDRLSDREVSELTHWMILPEVPPKNQGK